MTENHLNESLLNMTPLPTQAFRAALQDALVSEIKAELGRQSLSPTGLATALGENPQYVTTRLTTGNPRTGNLVSITVDDLVSICGALNLDPISIIQAAVASADASAKGRNLPTLAEARAARQAPGVQKTAARKQSKPRPGE